MIIYDVLTCAVLKAADHIFILYGFERKLRHDAIGYDITESWL